MFPRRTRSVCKTTLNVVFILIIVAINAWAKIYYIWAKRDGEIDRGEKFAMKFIGTLNSIMIIVDFAMIIWGSVVVFGAWANWTDDLDKYNNDDKYNYCKYTPMVFAFSTLITHWVSLTKCIDTSWHI